ncbi:MAG: CobW family GTP-binding protein, partial [Planctomycetota bacterium]
MTSSIDVLLVTGYLGAGKSTLLQNLLQCPEITQLHPALIINEFGQEGIDGRLFHESGWPLFEINRGSLFCICTQTELLNAFARITDLRPGIVLVEATGVAETRDIESLLDEASIKSQFRVRGNICVVDSLNFTKVAPFLKAARNQVAMADGIVVNKIDLVPAPRRAPLRQLLSEMNPRAVHCEVTRGGIEYSFLGRLSHQRATESLAVAQPDALHARSFHSRTPVDRTEFMQSIARLGS